MSPHPPRHFEPLPRRRSAETTARLNQDPRVDRHYLLSLPSPWRAARPRFLPPRLEIGLLGRVLPGETLFGRCAPVLHQGLDPVTPRFWADILTASQDENSKCGFRTTHLM